MAYRLVETMEIKNISAQLVIINVQLSNTSEIFDRRGGQINVKPNTAIEVEQARIDLQQLTQMRKNKLISTNNLTRVFQITTGTTGATGTT